MPYEELSLLKTRLDRGVLFVTIDNPPINLFDLPLMQQMNALGKEVEADEGVRVVVFDSANPEFFIAHADVNAILSMPAEAPPKPGRPGPFQAMVDRFRTMPKVTIARIEGRARGGGSEFVLSLDMRFAALGRAVLGQPEVALGILPGGSGTQRLPRLMGRGRALEVVLGCDDFPADLAERYGYVNRALPPDEIGPFVEQLAYRIASYPLEAIALAKQSVSNAADADIIEGLIEEQHLFGQLAAGDTARGLMRRFLERGGQSREADLEPRARTDGLGE